MARSPWRAAGRGGRPALLLAVALVVGSCSTSEPVDPAQARRDRVEARLQSTFSNTQARCILRQIDTSVLRALDGKKALPADSAELTKFSAAVRTCVSGGASTSTPSGPTTTG